MNDLRIFAVAIIAVVVGFAGAWMVFGGRAAKLADENHVLREQTGQLIQQLDNGQFDPRKLVGRWVTTVERSRIGKVELIVDLSDDGKAVWQSASGGALHPIADGQWKFQGPAAIDFDLLIVNQRSTEKGKRRTTLATIRESTPSCLVLDVDGTEWVFLRTS
jgi:hypothetical protein